MKRKKQNVYLNMGILITAVITCLILVGFFYTPFSPTKMQGTLKFAPPSLTHWLGCDNFGRDIFSRVLKGAGSTFFVGGATVILGGTVGVILGMFTGYYGGIIDEILMRVNDAVAAFPSILLALVFISILEPGKDKVILALGILFIPSFARIVRGEVLKYKNMDYVKSARLMGAGDIRIMFVHIFPNMIPVLLSAIAIGFNNAVLAEAGMSYLGIGLQPPDVSLGQMLSASQAYLSTAPWYALGPGLFLILLILGVGLIGEGLQEKTGGR